MSDRLREYTGRDILVRYDVKRCIHAAECVRGLPQVFDPQERPWIKPDSAEAAAIAEVIRRCPTGALSYEMPSDTQTEMAPPQNNVTVRPNGPLFLRGDVELKDEAGFTLVRTTRLALCRCGSSANKPFCDGRHTQAGFHDAAKLQESRTRTVDGLPQTHLSVFVATDGALVLSGPLELQGAEAGTTHTGNNAVLCRCGSSKSRPYCDGTHRQIGFKS